MKLLSFSIDGNSNYNVTGYQIQTPGQLTEVSNLRLDTLIKNGITIFLSVIIILSFVFVVIGGLKWLTSQGDKKAVEEARKTITFAIVGLILAFLSFFIITLVGYAFGIQLISQPQLNFLWTNY